MFDQTDPKTWAVLIVDDEPDNVEMTSEVLKFFGATVRTASNGLEGLEVLQGFTPNIILLDLSMPKMDGWVTRHQIRLNPATAHIPILALTAHAMAGDEQRALDAGFDGYIAKPIHVASLARDIGTQLKKKLESAPK